MRYNESRVIDFQVSQGVWMSIAQKALEEMNSPRALTCYILLKHGEFSQLAKLKVDPRHYNDVGDFQDAFMATELLRKSSQLPGMSASERRSEALKTSLAAERTNIETNRRILDMMHGYREIPGGEAFIQKVRRKISHVLGSYDLDEHLKVVRWGPGSDTLNKRPFISSYHKFKAGLACSRSCVPYVNALLERNHLWATWLIAREPEGPFSPLIPMISHDKYTTVPKTALTDRSICINPSLNIYFQLGLGTMIRRRLRRVGIELNSQEKNRMLALQGSEDSSWATIDLTSASDTIARRLIQFLFLDSTPEMKIWYRVLDDLRLKFTKYPNKDVLLNHKWSAMGNGYTFELETLVFWALASTAAEEEGGECAAVFGDDIIVSNHVAQHVQGRLEEFGFLVNHKKSFDSSYFRESCGLNAWNGYEIASYRLVKCESLADLYSFHNGMTRLGLTRTANQIRKIIPACYRFFGPSSLGDIVLHSPYIEHWKGQPYGLVDQWFFWGYRLKCLKFEASTAKCEAYEPAILASFASLVPDDPTMPYGHVGSSGSKGLATLSKGTWKIGEALVDRSSLAPVLQGTAEATLQ